MKNIWSVLCQESSVDLKTNKTSLFNCIDEITLNFFKKADMNNTAKNIQMPFEIASLWLKDVGDTNNFKILIDFCDPKDNVLKSFEQDFSFENNKKKLRTFIKINSMTITTEGVYKIKLNYQQKTKTKLAAELPIDVIFSF